MQATGGADQQDGLGWWLEYTSTLMMKFQMTERQALKYPLTRGLARCAFAMLRNGMVEAEIDGDGYILQESHRRKVNRQ